MRGYDGIFKSCVPEILDMYRAGFTPGEIAAWIGRNGAKFGYGNQYDGPSACNVTYIVKREGEPSNAAAKKRRQRMMFRDRPWVEWTPESTYAETEKYG